MEELAFALQVFGMIWKARLQIANPATQTAQLVPDQKTLLVIYAHKEDKRTLLEIVFAPETM